MKYFNETLKIILLFLISNVNLIGQKAFDCNGRMFRVIEQDAGTSFQEIKIQYDPFEISFEELDFFKDVELNGVCYRPDDNLIYGVELGDFYRLVQIDASYNLRILKDLPLPPQLHFVSGDISPDGRYLVLLGFSMEEEGNLLAMVDLSDTEYPTTLIPLRSYGDQKAINCVDIAFHPSTGILYGFDHAQDKMVSIDIEKRLIDDQRFPKSTILSGNMPSLFFDPQGRLFGIASSRQNNSNRILYEIDPSTGHIEKRQNLEKEFNQDACSCPYEVNLYNRINTRQGFPCTELEFTFSLINKSPVHQIGLSFRDTFHSGLIIKSIEGLSKETRILSGLGSNILALDGLDLDVGSDTIKVRVEVPEAAPQGIFKNRAYLSHVNAHLDEEGELRLSDDPDTPVSGDATAYELKSLEINFEEDFPILCEGDAILLDVNILGADYMWSTGESSQSIKVMEEGIYEITVSSGCDTAIGAIYVGKDEISVDLGEVIETQEGTSIQLVPSISSGSEVRNFFWSFDENGPVFDCITCFSPRVKIYESSQFGVEIINENGCSAYDELAVKVDGFKHFAPTAFSPDGNGVNDYFYLQGKYDFDIRRFSVFNRWGALVYDKTEGKANDQFFGWDGFYKGSLLDAGLYVWRAEVKLANGEILQLAGEVNLIL